ncbi:uncharacterized protein LOC131635129 [Vicia villosa]|uniref:uncharacterized protein LOC131635129 n=2 Tax=Vicia villosa TaxID=3911 RepID=UPI00273B5C4B|nr:uncharacterized protein LOC131635129 [Vicia villosa]
MEFFNKSKTVKLRSHLGKYLVADSDKNNNNNLRQSKKGTTKTALWSIELVENKPHHIRLRSHNGRYLTATDTPFLLGMTGDKVVLTDYDAGLSWKYEWEPIKEGYSVKLRSWCGKLLRGNGGTPPWRNSVTHDDPYTAATNNWILWGVEAVDDKMNVELLSRVSFVSNSSFGSEEDEVHDSELVTSEKKSWSSLKFRRNSKLQPESINSLQKPSTTTNNSFTPSSMELFQRAKAVRLRSHHDKYLHAEEDEESINQERNGSSKNAKWTVEHIPEFDNIIRLKSCYGKYLTASNQPLLLGVTGRKVVQTLPRRLDSSVEWEPVRDGAQVKLKTRYGNFLRANGGLPPWRNSVTHDIPHRSATQDWILWDVDVLEIHVGNPPPPPIPHSDSLDFGSSALSFKSNRFDRQESTDSVGSPPKMEGRTIYYHVAEENGDVDDENVQGYSLVFNGNDVEQLTRKFVEETGLDGVIVCSRSPLNGKLYPLRLHLPPNNVMMQVVLVLASSKVAKEFEEQGLL